jgi:hypothetical protein
MPLTQILVNTSFVLPLEKYIDVFYMRKTGKVRKTRKNKRPLTDWNLFVMKVKKANPNMTFKQVLKKASIDRKKGKM